MALRDHCDNDVVDHQIVMIELENDVSVSFTMHGHSFEEGRTIRIDGSKATLLGKFAGTIPLSRSMNTGGAHSAV